MSPRQKTHRAGIYARQSQAKLKSIGEQIGECTADAEAQGWPIVGIYDDPVSASRFGTKVREDHDKLVADIEAGRIDVVVTWRPDRTDRKLTTWSALLDLCREHNVLLRVTDHGYTYDVANSNRDWKALANAGVEAASYSDDLSTAVKRGLTGAAEAGRPPHGMVPFGWRKVYAPETGKLIGLEPNPEQAPVVVEIIERIAKGEPLSHIARDLNERGITTARGTTWHRSRIKDTLNVVHIGYRSHNGTKHKGAWDAIVDESVFWAARRICDARKDSGERAGRSEWVLRGVARCAVCGATLDGLNARPRGGKLVRRYRCYNSCVGLLADDFEDYVLAFVLGRLARKDVYSQLRHGGEAADAEVAAARQEAEELRVRLGEYRQRARRGLVDPDDFTEISAGLKADIKAAERRAERAGVPPQVRALLEPGEDLATRWASMPLAARRDAVAALVDVVVDRGHRGMKLPIEDRVSVVWKGA